MTDDIASAPPSWVLAIRAKLDPYLTPSRREAAQRALAALVAGLLATGVLTAEKAALWSQLGTSTLALLFALLFAGTALRAAGYSVLLVVFGLGQAYGIAKGVDWAIIVGFVGQAFGITTAAAKAQPPGT